MTCNNAPRVVEGGQASGSDSDSLLTEVKGLRVEIGQLNKQLPIPFGLRKVLQETLSVHHDSTNRIWPLLQESYRVSVLC